jgi:hypothetical protein
MGLIDDGLCMASERFRTRRGNTRLMSAWIQHFEDAGLRPRLFDYGREINETEFNGSLKQPDEDAFYRDIELFDPRFEEAFWSQYRVTHATHVMDVAAGFDPGSALANERRRPIVAVQLPEVIVADGSGHSLGSYVLDGLRYIVERVEKAKQGLDPAPVVVNISYGNNAGPHDGMSDLERAMDEIVSTWHIAYPKIPFVIVLPAGNSFRAQGHARLRAADLAHHVAKSLRWQIHPDDGTASLIEIWLPPGYPRSRHDLCSLQITTPGGLNVAIATRGNQLAELVDDDGVVLAQALYSPPSRGRPRAMFQICVAPTMDPVTINQFGRQPAPHGVWDLRVAATGLPKRSEIHAWIQRDDQLRRSAIVGRQSHFVDESNPDTDAAGFPIEDDAPSAIVRRAGSLNAIGTGQHTVVVGGGYERIDIAERWPRTALYSGGGDGGAAGAGVDIVATSEDSIVLSGILGAGTRSGAHVRVNGTSVAAPAIARAIAAKVGLFVGKKPKDAVPHLLDRPNGVRHPRKGWGHRREQ